MKLCDYHEAVIANLRHLDHVGDEDSARAALEHARQCPQCTASPVGRTQK